jgi:hypothetical protein
MKNPYYYTPEHFPAKAAMELMGAKTMTSFKERPKTGKLHHSIDYNHEYGVPSISSMMIEEALNYP